MSATADLTADRLRYGFGVGDKVRILTPMYWYLKMVFFGLGGSVDSEPYAVVVGFQDGGVARVLHRPSGHMALYIASHLEPLEASK